MKITLRDVVWMAVCREAKCSNMGPYTNEWERRLFEMWSVLPLYSLMRRIENVFRERGFDKH